MQWVAFMRALNVGGRRLTNEELVDVFAEVGLVEPQAYQASGNVVFTAPDTGSSTNDAQALERTLGTALEARFGYPVPTMLRGAARVHEIAAAEPFNAATMAATAGKVQVLLLDRAPSAENQAHAEVMVPDGEALAFDDRVAYWLPANGISDSAFDVAGVERVLGTLTVRTQGTVQRLANKFL